MSQHTIAQPVLTYLLIEDNDLDAERLRRQAQRSPFLIEIVRRSSGGQAIELLVDAAEHLERFYPCVVLLDLSLPCFTGLEVLERLSVSDQRSSVPIVVLTSSNSTVERAMSLERGALDFLVKPVDSDVIVRVHCIAESFWQRSQYALPSYK